MSTAERIYQKFSSLGVQRDIVLKMCSYMNPQELYRAELDQGYFWDKYQEALKFGKNSPPPQNYPVYNTDYGGQFKGAVSQEDLALNMAIQDSLKANQPGTGSYEPLEIDQRVRKNGEFVGLKNIGNTCYFNSLLQTFFRIKVMVQKVLDIPVRSDRPTVPPKDASPEERRQHAADGMCLAMQRLFANMITTKEKYADPAGVINRLVDERGEAIKIGDQKDIVEVMVAVLERLQEAMSNDKTNVDDLGVDEGVSAARGYLPKLQAVKTLAELDSNKFVSSQSQRRVSPDTKFQEKISMNNSMIEKGIAWSDSHHEKLLSSSQVLEKGQGFSKFTAHGPESDIQRLFFGRMIGYEINGEKEIAGQEEIFGPIILDPSTSDFYRSWENFFMTDIGPSANHYKWGLVTKMPEVLTFQINRVSFNREKQTAEKNNQHFYFPTTIYTDRFLQENKFTVQSIRQKKLRLEQYLDEVESGIQNIEEHNQDVNLVKSIQALQHYLHEQPSFPISLMTNLKQVQEDMERKLADLKYRKESVSQEIKGIFSKIEKSKYSVFSIIIHEGTAESGHYYCFIKLARDCWVKFNDFHTKQFTEDEVLAIAYGDKGSSAASAYCVFYMRDDLFAKCPQHTYSIDRRDGYYPMLKADLAVQMEQKNKTFLRVVFSHPDADRGCEQEDRVHLLQRV